MTSKNQKSQQAKVKLPHGAVYRASANKKYMETIVFVHHFGGTQLTSKRHQEYFNELGFDCVAFDLIYNDFKRTPLRKQTFIDAVRGFRHAWADQIEDVLRSLDSPQIVFSFSMPGGGALEAMSRRPHSHLKGWIAEGGPFLQTAQCYWNYMNRFYPKTLLPFKVASVAGSFLLLGAYDYRKDVKDYFSKLPDGFPILSVRAWQDGLVPIAAIDEFFECSKTQKVEILSLPEADHLQGLKEYPADYKPRVEKFLNKVATPLDQKE